MAGMKPRGNRFGSELTFSQTITDSAPRTKVGVIKVAYVGTSLRHHWHLAATNDPLMYMKMTQCVQNGLQRLTQDEYLPSLEAFVWSQGKGDGRNEPWTTDCRDRLNKFLSKLRLHFSEPDLPSSTTGCTSIPINPLPTFCGSARASLPRTIRRERQARTAPLRRPCAADHGRR